MAIVKYQRENIGILREKDDLLRLKDDMVSQILELKDEKQRLGDERDALLQKINFLSEKVQRKSNIQKIKELQLDDLILKNVHAAKSILNVIELSEN